MPRRNGFTVLELTIALVIGAILLSLAVNAFGSVQTRIAAASGARTFQSMLARARAQAIETGEITMLRVDTPGDSVWIVRDGEILESIRFDQEMGVEITGSPNNWGLCMTARGFADPDCNTMAGGARVIFAQGQDADTVIVLPSGQLVR